MYKHNNHMFAQRPTVSPSPTYAHIRNDVGIFTNIFCILDKVEEDRNLELLSDTFRQIFEKEIEFTITGAVTRTPKTAREDAGNGPAQSTGYKHCHFQGEPAIDNRLSQFGYKLSTFGGKSSNRPSLARLATDMAEECTKDRARKSRSLTTSTCTPQECSRVKTQSA